MSASQPNARGLHRGSSNLSERSTPRGRTTFNVSTPKLACLANTLDRLRSYRFVTLSLEGGKYVGETLRGTKTRNGYGQMMYKNGNIYDGEWCHDLPHGKGLKHFANGDVYEGEWIQGMRHGYGEYRWAQEGATYHGFYERDQPNGSGTLEFRSRGQKYVGQWLNGLQHGEGIETTTRSSETGFAREGQWVLGKKNGIFTVMITCAQSVPRRAQELWDQDHLIGTDPTCSIPLLKYPPTTTLPLRKTLHKNTIPSLRSLYMSLNHFIDEVIQSTVDDMVVIEKVEAIWREEEAQKRLEKVREHIHPFH